jgi:Uncharacterized conserved protein
MIELGFNKTTIPFVVDKARLLGVLEPNVVEVKLTGEAEVSRALENPIGAPKLSALLKASDRVAIVTSDITRPLPSKEVLPPVLRELYAAGVTEENIVIVFGLGSHRPHTEDEKKYLVGEKIYGKIRCVDSDETKCVHLGETSHGTPVDIFKEVAEADFIICLGNIEYHYFAGYSGGSKAIMPGISTRAAIQKNHSMMINERAIAGNLESPVRKDIEEAAKLVGIGYIVNVVLDEHKRIIYAVAGDEIAAHRDGCAFLDALYKIKIKERAEIVIVSAGGYPKDQNMYQAQKALDNAKHAVKDGGVIIWLASCREGFGSAIFETWMKEKHPEQMLSDIKNNFVLGGHKAAAVAQVLLRAEVYLVSDLDDETVKSVGFTPYKSLNEAYAAATAKLGEKSKVYVMPYGGSTLPEERR